MNLNEFAAFFDHTALKPETKHSDIELLCEQALKYQFATVCINPCYLPKAVRILEGSSVLPITVVGFPLGANCSVIKSIETEKAVAEGAREIDMVMNLGALKDRDESAVIQDIIGVIAAAQNLPVKVIIETALLSKEEIILATQWSIKAGAHYVKTSTGFSTRGASVDDVKIMSETAKGQVKIKASGGIKSLAQAIDLIEAGAQRLGSSNSVGILEEFRKKYKLD